MRASLLLPYCIVFFQSSAAQSSFRDPAGPTQESNFLSPDFQRENTLKKQILPSSDDASSKVTRRPGAVEIDSAVRLSKDVSLSQARSVINNIHISPLLRQDDTTADGLEDTTTARQMPPNTVSADDSLTESMGTLTALSSAAVVTLSNLSSSSASAPSIQTSSLDSVVSSPPASTGLTEIPIMTLTFTTTPQPNPSIPVASLFPTTTIAATTYDPSDPNAALYKCFDEAELDYLTPQNDSFEEALKVWNLILESRPAAYLTPYSISEVADAVRCTVASNRTVTARGGGHSYVGASRGQDSGVTLDLKYMNEVVLDSDFAYIGAGARMGTVYYQLWQQGKRLVPGGTCPQVGAVGLTMGGGQGIASRKYGLMADNVVEYDVVLATGEIVKANATENKELFWALRGGGGGNFGIVTRMKILTFAPPPKVSAHQVQIPANLTGAFLRQIMEFAKIAPPEFGGYFAIASVGVVGYLTYMGPLRDLDFYAHDILDTWGATVSPVPIETDWLDLYWQVSQTTYPTASTRRLELTPSFEQPGVYARIKSAIAKETDEIPQAILDLLQGEVSLGDPAITLINVEMIGGAINGIPSDATAFPHRDGVLLIEPTVTSAEPLRDAQEAWVTQIYETLISYVTGGSYVNFADENLSRPGSSFYGANFPALQILKEVWDPRNTFNFSLSINNLEA